MEGVWERFVVFLKERTVELSEIFFPVFFFREPHCDAREKKKSPIRKPLIGRPRQRQSGA